MFKASNNNHVCKRFEGTNPVGIVVLYKDMKKYPGPITQWPNYTIHFLYDFLGVRNSYKHSYIIIVHVDISSTIGMLLLLKVKII